MIPDSAERVNKGFGLTGKTEQLNTRGVNLWRSDSTVIVSGTKYLMFDNPIQTGTYTLSAIFANDKSASESLFTFYNEQNQSMGGGTIKQGGRQSKTFTLTGKAVKVLFYASSGHDSSQGVTTTIKEIQLETGNTATPYEPYTGGKPSPSLEYEQEVKNAGKRDEGTQKYEVDVKVTNAEQNWSKEQVLTLTSDRPITKWDKLVEQGGQIGWLYQSASDTDVKPSRLDLFPYGFSLFKDFGNGVYVYKVVNIKKAIGFQTSLCEQFKNKDGSYSTGDLFCYSDQPSIQMQYFVTDIPTLEEFKTWMETNPLTMVYQTVESQFVPLQQSEQNAIRALKTYYPTTVITVDGGELDPDIKVTYTADTKLYIDNKFAQLQKSLVNTNTQLL